MVSQWRSLVSRRWFQLKCDKIFAALTVGVLSVGVASSPCYAKSQKLPKLLQEVEKKYSQSSTLVADFSQSNFNKTTSQTTDSQGKLYVKKPSRVRWETKAPDPNLLIGN